MIRQLLQQNVVLVWLYGKVKLYRRKKKFKRDFNSFKSMNDNRFDPLWAERLSCLNDSTAKSSFDKHYVYHTAWAARILAGKMPERHVDISSDLRFVTLVSAFVPIDFYDFRPADMKLANLSSNHCNLTELPFEDASLQSLSCLHVIEHVGLGRYGDTLDTEGDLKAAAELERVLAFGGDLLIAVPVGKPRIMFNAHRIYSYEMVLAMFFRLTLKSFSLIPDSSDYSPLVDEASTEMVSQQKYACGCFHFEKRR